MNALLSKQFSSCERGAFYLASNAAELESIYDDINKKIDIETDSDSDGIADYYEENMVMFNGVTMKLDKNNPDTDGDGLLDGEEVAELNYQYNKDKTQVIVTGKFLCDPSSIDTDGDGLTDEEELYYYGTSPLLQDTDGDGLNDKLEVDEWYDPFARDTDGDGRLDAQEYRDGSSPFVYDKNWYDHAWDFITGFIAGDFIYDTDSLAVLMGQIASGFIPFVDIRDVLANLAHGDYIFAGLNALGILSVDGDLTQIAGMVGRYISKHTNISEVAMVLEYLNRNYPDVVNALPQSPEFLSVAKDISYGDLSKVTEKEAENIITAFEKAGLSDYLIKGGNYGYPNRTSALLEGLSGTTREKLLGYIQDDELSKIVNQLYRPGATVGDGGTAAMLVYEYKNGSLKHLQKATERLQQLRELQCSGKLGLNDLDIIEALIDDLEYAIGLYN